MADKNGSNPAAPSDDGFEIHSDAQAIELLTRREHLFVNFLSLTERVEEINEQIYLVTCEIEGINKAFRGAIEKGSLSEQVLVSLRNAVNENGTK